MSQTDPSQTQAPRFTVQEVSEQVQRLYGKSFPEVKELESYSDQNFYLKDEVGREYIFKVSNSMIAKDVLDFQHSVMKRLADRNVCKVARICHTSQGEEIATIRGADGGSYLVRLLTYLPGRFLADVKPHTPEILEELGTMMGSIAASLLDFCHSGAHQFLVWDVKNLLKIEPEIQYIANEKERALVKSVLAQFRNYVIPIMPDLRTSVIHNDGNDYNVLLGKKGDDSWSVTGIIDFGDSVHTYTVCELAIALAYAIQGKEDIPAAAIPVILGFHKALPLNANELEVLYYLICGRLATTVAMSAYRQVLEPENKYLKVSEKPAWDALKKLMTLGPVESTRLFFSACGMQRPGDPGREASEILEVRKEKLGPSLSVSYDRPLKIVRGYGQYLYSREGRAYLDCVNNVCHVGHCHPRVVEAAREQVAMLNTNTRYLHDNIINYAEKLTSLFPDSLSVCFFVNSGSEANDLALRMARTYRHSKETIVVDHAYHGNLTSLIEISAYKFDGPGGSGALEHIHKVPMPDPYRGPYKYDDPQAGHKYAAHVGEVISNLAKEGKKPSAFICESLPGVGGQIVMPPHYLEQAYSLARRAGAVCIADEVQVGFGRVGDYFWGFETQGVVPDIVTLGKPIGNGHPLGAVITTPEIASAFHNGMEYFNTFGGNPVSCAVGLAVLEVLLEENLKENARDTGNYLKERLTELIERHTLIGDVRGMGLFIGIELVKDRRSLEPAAREASAVVNHMKERGILLSTDGPLHNVIKIKPPIVFNRQNADMLVENLDQVLAMKEFKS